MEHWSIGTTPCSAGFSSPRLRCPSIPFSPMPSLRLQRVRELLKRAIGEAIRQELPVSEAGLVSVNDVDVAGDLKSATVFISILGSPEQQKRGFALLAQQ